MDESHEIPTKKNKCIYLFEVVKSKILCTPETKSYIHLCTFLDRFVFKIFAFNIGNTWTNRDQARRSRDQCEGEVLPDFLGGRAGGLAAGGVDSVASQCLQWRRGAAAPVPEPKEDTCAELAALEKAVTSQLSKRSLDEPKLWAQADHVQCAEEVRLLPQSD